MILDELFFEGGDFFGGRGEAGEVEGGAADEGAGVGVRCRVLHGEQGIHWMFIRLYGGFLDGLVGPEAFGLVAAAGPFGGECAGGFDGDAVFFAPFCGVGFRYGVSVCFVRPWGTRGDPCFDPVQLIRVELVGFLGRHGFPVGFVLACGGEVEGAFFWLTGDDGGLFALAAFEGALQRAHVEAAFDLLFVIAVAGEALLLKQGPHAADEQCLGFLGMERGGKHEGGKSEEACHTMNKKRSRSVLHYHPVF